MKTHLNTHGGACGPREVSFQRWSLSHGNGLSWVVVMPTAAEGGSTVTPASPLINFVDRQDRLEAARRRQQEEMREKLRVTDRNKKDDTSPWLLHTKWPKKFDGKAIKTISMTRLLVPPDPRATRTSSCITPSNLKTLSRAFDQIMARCFETLESTSPETLRWLRSPQAMEADWRTFKRLQEVRSETRYINYWKQFLYYVFRTALMREKQRNREHGIKFTEDQLRLVKEIAGMLKALDGGDVENAHDDEDDDEDDAAVDDGIDSDDEEEGEEERWESVRKGSNHGRFNETLAETQGGIDDLSPTERLEEKLFQLCVKFVMQRSEWEDESALCHFTAVLGIDMKKGTFRRPHNYTPMLSGIIWVNRLLMLEYALPKRAYRTLGWQDRKAYGDGRIDRFEQVRRACLVNGSYSPMSYILDLLMFGRSRIRLEGQDCLIDWLDGGETLRVKDIRLGMTDFRGFLHELLGSLEDVMYDDLLFGTSSPPTVDLERLPFDDMTEARVGYWIGEDLANSTRGGHAYMVRLAQDEGHLMRGTDWDYDKVQKYLAKKKLFLELLFVAKYLLGGGPSRGDEAGSVKFRNSAQSVRNLNVDKARMYSYIGYNKSRAARNNSFYVVRYLPEALARLTFIYVAFIRPFAHSLYCQLHADGQEALVIDDGDYLFCEEGRPDVCWLGPKLSSILQRETEKRLGVRINLWAYRHIAIAITRRHVKEIAAHFAKDDKACERQLYAWNLLDIICAFQAGHELETEIANYALDRAYPNKLQPWLLGLYQLISDAWQEYWGFPPPGSDSDGGKRRWKVGPGARRAITGGLIIVERDGTDRGRKKRREEGPKAPQDVAVGLANARRDNTDQRNGEEEPVDARRDNINQRNQRPEEGPKTPQRVARTSEARNDPAPVAGTPSKLFEAKIWDVKAELEEKENQLRGLEARFTEYKQGKAQVARATAFLI